LELPRGSGLDVRRRQAIGGSDQVDLAAAPVERCHRNASGGWELLDPNAHDRDRATINHHELDAETAQGLEWIEVIL
jgi:hypothetical protein